MGDSLTIFGLLQHDAGRMDKGYEYINVWSKDQGTSQPALTGRISTAGQQSGFLGTQRTADHQASLLGRPHFADQHTKRKVSPSGRQKTRDPRDSSPWVQGTGAQWTSPRGGGRSRVQQASPPGGKSTGIGAGAPGGRSVGRQQAMFAGIQITGEQVADTSVRP